MRVLVIEKKIAKRYDGGSSSEEIDTSASTHQRSEDHNVEERQPNEEQPLLGSKKATEDNDAWKLNPDQPKIAHMVPILPCLKNPSLLASLLVALVQAICLGSFDATVPLVAREYFGFDSLKGGLLFLPLGAFDLVLGPVFGWAVDRYGTKVVAVSSYTYLVPAFVLLRLPHAGGLHQVLLYGGCLAICGVGLAGIGAPSMVEAGAVVEKYYDANPEFFGEQGPYAQLYGLQSMVFSAGLSLGPEVAGQLRLAIGYGNMNAILAGICGFTAVLCFIYLGGKPHFLSKGRE
jgi:MFS family permease